MSSKYINFKLKGSFFLTVGSPRGYLFVAFLKVLSVITLRKNITFTGRGQCFTCGTGDVSRYVLLGCLVLFCFFILLVSFQGGFAFS